LRGAFNIKFCGDLGKIAFGGDSLLMMLSGATPSSLHRLFSLPDAEILAAFTEPDDRAGSLAERHEEKTPPAAPRRKEGACALSLRFSTVSYGWAFLQFSFCR